MDMAAPSPPGGVGCKRVSGGDSAPVFLTYSLSVYCMDRNDRADQDYGKGGGMEHGCSTECFSGKKGLARPFAAVATMSLRRFIGFLPG